MARHRLLKWFGSPEAVFFADKEACRQVEGLSGKALRSLADKSLDCADEIAGECDRLGIHIMTMQDANYPERLRVIHQPPMVLYWKGREPAVDETAVIGMVGTRKSTPYGERMARELALDLTRAGALVVSGMAEGIDAASLRGALSAGGPVISVVGNGLDVVYPRFHRDLYEDVTLGGTLMSEYPPGTEPRGSNFPQRNRIISGLSVGVTVVESPRRGGSLLTAEAALDQDREVFAVPGPADAPNSEGTNRLIQEGAAKLILSADDVLCEFEGRFPSLLRRARPMSPEVRAQRLGVPLPEAPKRRRPANPPEPAAEKVVDNPDGVAYIDWKENRDRLTDDQRDILLVMDGGAMYPDEVMERTGIPAKRVLSALTVLQILGMAEEQSGRRFKALVKLKGVESV